jgi:type I restriction enzyme R subunit
MTPERKARRQIDPLLQQSGWIVQDRSGINLAAGPGVAIREAALKTGEAALGQRRSLVEHGEKY